MRAPSELAIGVANQGDPTDPAAFSGAPAALLGGLAEVVARAVPLPGRLPGAWEWRALRAAVLMRLRPRDVRDLRGAVRRAHFPAYQGTLMQRLHDARLARGLRAAGVLDGVIQHGTEVHLPPGTRYVTYEDATTIQARRHWPWAHLEHASEADHARYARRGRVAYAAARACCAMSHWAARSLVADYGLAAERVHVVGVGAVRRLRPPAARDWSTPRFLFVGFDWERKNGAAVVRAFAAVRARHPAATLDVVGGHPRLDAPGVTGHGVLALDDPSALARLQALYDPATCFAMPSLHEPSAQAFIEAGSAGVPSLGSSDGGSATVIGDGGLVVDPRDDAAIAAAMLELADGARAAALGALAQRQAARLTWPLVAERLVRALAPEGTDVSGLAEFL